MPVRALTFTNETDKFLLSKVAWQLIGMLSFREAKFSEGRQVARFIGALRAVARRLGVGFSRLPWGLKLEWGEFGDRAHFHFVLAGLPASEVTPDTCTLLERAWAQKHGGIIAQVELYDPTRNGLAYVAKRPAWRPQNETRQTAKFGCNGDEIHFSEAFMLAAKQR
jgi:hypothetical protein